MSVSIERTSGIGSDSNKIKKMTDEEVAEVCLSHEVIEELDLGAVVIKRVRNRVSGAVLLIGNTCFGGANFLVE